MSRKLAIAGGKIILGIDPGTTIMGYSILEASGKNLNLLQLGILNLKSVPNHAVKLRKIFDHTQQLIEEYLPDEMAIEAQFFGKNVQSMLKLGRAQGVAIAAALSRDIPYMEYAPKKVKQSVTGNGNASKEQVARTLALLLKLPETAILYDATDALSVALCHHYQSSGGYQVSSTKGTASTWAGFVAGNPGRIK